MNRIILLILFIIFYNKAIASVQGEVLICDKDTKGYSFISKDMVKVFSIS